MLLEMKSPKTQKSIAPQLSKIWTYKFWTGKLAYEGSHGRVVHYSFIVTQSKFSYLQPDPRKSYFSGAVLK